jgi:EAL domain-containing protein (putative c-di-GMP-specific phosphodiesterase class I)
VKRYQFEKGFIRFEIRLDVLVKNLNLDDVKALKEELNKIGIELVIDNVNSEAILESIAKCGINKVKIDRSITKDVLSADYNDVTEYARISSYCFRNGFEVVAEGIESKEVLDACRAYGTTSFQGYYFAKPMEGQRFIEFLNYGK